MLPHLRTAAVATLYLLAPLARLQSQGMQARTAQPADSLRGRSLATYVLIEAADGYRVLFSIAELESGFTDRVVILADQKDGHPLPAAEGPYRLIVPGEKRPARWARQVVRVSLGRPS
jgi:hypothetical protein